MVRNRVQYQQALVTRTSRYTGLLALPAIKNREKKYGSSLILWGFYPT